MLSAGFLCQSGSSFIFVYMRLFLKTHPYKNYTKTEVFLPRYVFKGFLMEPWLTVFREESYLTKVRVR